jgi:hypothetical protein
MADDQNRKTPIQMTPEAMQEALAAEGKQFEAEQQTQKVEAEVDDLLAQITAPSSQAVPQQSDDKNKTVDQLLEELLPAEKAQAKDEEEKKKEQEMISVGEAADVVKAETEKNEAKEEKTDIELDNLMKDVFGDNELTDKQAADLEKLEDLLGMSPMREKQAIENNTISTQVEPQEAVKAQTWVSAKPSPEVVESKLQQVQEENEKILDKLDSILDAAEQKLEADKLTSSLSEGQVAPQVDNSTQRQGTIYKNASVSPQPNMPTRDATPYVAMPAPQAVQPKTATVFATDFESQPVAVGPQEPARATIYVNMPNADDRAPKATVYTELPKSLEEPTVAASAEVKETPSVEQAVIVPDLQLVEQKPQEAVKAQQWVSARPTAVQEADDLISALSEGQTADSKMKAEADNLIAGLSEGQTAELSESEIKSMLSDLEAPIAAPQPEQEADPKRQQVTDELMKAKESATLQMQEKKGGRIQEILERGKQSEHKIIQKVSEKASSFLDRVTNSKSENKDVQR